MGRYVARKLIHMVVVLLLVSFATSLMLDLTPGDPAYAILGDQATPAAVKSLHQELGLDRPFYVRYGDWLSNLARGDLGTSYEYKQSVSSLISQALPVTAELIVLTLLLALAIAVPLGVYSARRVGGIVDRGTTFVTSIFVSAPPFISVPFLVFLFVLTWHIFPATGWVKFGDSPMDNLQHIVLPVIALSLWPVAAFTAALRSDTVATLQEDFILSARAKGLSTRSILFRHALRPSSFSLMTLAGLSLGTLIGSAVIVEYLFALPGIGSLIISAINVHDIPLVQGVVMFTAVVYVVMNTAVDILYRYLDPRLRMQKA
ncbi:MAG: binding-protein-dependent transport system inner rane component [Actinomycetia bacterium]|nr:binding-protein-dependent transport system inner rane component [Actinomycetes bacterium]